MCRISGTVNYTKEMIEKMVNHQKRGGPDYSNIQEVSSNIFFGHNLLSIIGDQVQPLNGGDALTYNGEWYNYKDFYPYEESDTMALWLSIHKHDQKPRNGNSFRDAINDINGMFSIGYFDCERKKIYLAVDRFSQKSIYYYQEGDKFAFASSPGALLHLKPKWEIDKDMMQSYWLLGSCMGSMWKGIKKLGAAEMLTYDVSRGTIEIERYWEPKFQENTSGIEDLVLDAINKVKISDVPIHIFLSGGIDSTLVASQFACGSAIHLDSPERKYAQQVADKFGIDMKVVDPEEIKVAEYLTDYSLECGEPTMAGLIPYMTSKETSKFGRVAITANGADELFFGYDRTHELNGKPQMDHTYRSIERPKNWKWPFPMSFQYSEEPKGRLVELEGYVQYDLNKTLDFASMCHGLEVRSPFLDHRLVEMALSINEKEHRVAGNKSILKDMLRKMGFSEQFLNRPKLGFSLHKQPDNIDKLISMTWKWVKSEGFLQCDDSKLSGRDKKYLEMSALGFYYWYACHSNKIL